MIKAGQTWRRKSDGKRFEIYWVSDELVTIFESGSLATFRKFEFLQDFEEINND